MLTVNWTDVDGIQALYEVSDVRYDPNYGCGSGPEREPCFGKVHIKLAEPVSSDDLPTWSELTVNSGRVFVMNSDGRTIAKYELGGWLKGPPPNQPVG